MKKIFALLLALVLVFSLAACGEEREAYGAVGEPLVVLFEENADKTPQEIADLVMAHESIEFMPMTMPVEEGYLAGFTMDITGFEEAVMFGPMIGTIPFVGYVFELSEDADVEAFEHTLKDSADLRWNICTEADEMIVESVDNKVFFLMCPATFEQEETPEDLIVDDGAIVEDMPVYDEEDITLE